MRVTQNMVNDTAINNLGPILERLGRLQGQLSSGKRINKPSDDPIGVSAALGFQTELDRIDQHRKNIDAATAWLNTTEQALGSVGTVLNRARELAVQGANGTLSQTDRAAMRQEVNRLVEEVVAAGNASYAGQYVLSGYKTSTVPFTIVGDPPTSVTYDGDGGQMLREVDDQVTMAINISNGGPIPQALATLITLGQRLDAGDLAGVSAIVSDIDTAIAGVLSARAQVGAKVNRLESAGSRLDEQKTNIAKILSNVADVDMAQTIQNFADQQAVYQAALKAGARAIQPSLLDYLR